MTPAAAIFLVSCVSQKRDVASPARDFYISEWFRKARRYVEMAGGPWFILSAKYGLVEPEQQIEPYDCTLNTMKIADRREWAERVASQLALKTPGAQKYLFLAGLRYREFLVPLIESSGVQVEVPMSGLQIGQQLRWLNQRLRAAE